MVVFTCDGCGDTVKLQKVEQHCQMCRRAGTVSCMDCLKTFHDDEYKTHNKCVSEEQKYSAKGFVSKENKGEVKQASWVEQVQAAIEATKSGDQRLLNLLQNISNYSNIPRKEKKFLNFLANSLRIRDTNLAKRAWDAITISKATPKNATEEVKDEKVEKPETNGGEEASKKPNKKRKKEALNGEEPKNKKAKSVEEVTATKNTSESTIDEVKEEKNEKPEVNGEEKTSRKSKKKRKKGAMNGEEVEATMKKRTSVEEVTTSKNTIEGVKAAKVEVEETKINGEEETSAKPSKKRKKEALNGEEPTKKMRKSVEEVTATINTSTNTMEEIKEEKVEDEKVEERKSVKEVATTIEQPTIVEVVKKTLKAAPDNRMKLRKLQKTVVAQLGIEIGTEAFSSILNNARRLSVDDDNHVSLTPKKKN